MQVYNDELYHFGKKGMKWGHRIKQNIQAQNQMVKDQFRHPIQSTKAQISLIRKDPKKALLPDTKTIEKLNADVKSRVDKHNADTKTKVETYKKSFDAASKASDKADAHWSKTRELYKKTGNNAVSRIINNIKGKGEAVKKYNDSFNKSEKLYNEADKKWAKSHADYQKTGSNRVSRIINNIKN